MLEWHPPRARIATINLMAVSALVLLDVWAVSWIRYLPVGLVSLGMGLAVAASLVLFVVFAYALYQTFSLKYLVGRNALTIVCGGRRYIVPLNQIQKILPGIKGDFTASTPAGSRFGYWIGRGQRKDGGEVLFLTTLPPQEQILLQTESRTYALSPANPAGFLLALQARRQIGPSRRLEEESVTPAWLSLPLWQDRLAQRLLASVMVTNFALYAFVVALFPLLPAVLPFHYNAWGLVDRIEPKSQILFLPTIGLIVLGFNSVLGAIVHRWEPLATYFLFATSLAVQILLGIAVIHIAY